MKEVQAEKRRYTRAESWDISPFRGWGYGKESGKETEGTVREAGVRPGVCGVLETKGKQCSGNIMVGIHV